MTPATPQPIPSLPVLPANGFVRRFWLVAAGIGLIATAAGIVVYGAHRAGFRAAVLEQLDTVAELKVRQVSDWRAERLNDARFLASTPAIARSVADLLRDPTSEAARREVIGWLQPFRAGERYRSILVLDRNLDVVARLPDGGAAPGAHLRAQLPDVFKRTTPILTDLHRSDSVAAPHLELMVPIHTPPTGAEPAAPAGDAIAAIVLRLDPADNLFQLLQRWPAATKSAETMLVRYEGTQVVYLNELRHRPGSALNLQMPVNTPRLAAASRARGTNATREGVDYRGVDVLFATREIPGTGWNVVAKIDRAEAYAPLRREAWQIAAFAVLTALGGSLAAGYAMRSRENRLLHRTLQAESERKRMAERLAALTSFANDIIVLGDEAGRIVEANQRALEVYGYSMEELRALTLSGLRARDCRDEFPHALNAIHVRGAAVVETLHQKKDGTVFPVEINGRSVAVDGRTHFLGVIRDITERKAAEVALRESETRYRSVFENSHVCMLIVQPGTGAILDANPAATRFYGWSGEQLRAKRVTDLNTADISQINRRMLEAGSDRCTFMTKHRLASGSIRDVEVSSGPISLGGKPLLLSIVTDITERRAAEEALRLRSAALEAAANAILITDRNGRIEWANPAFVEHTGWPLNEVVGRTPGAIVKSGAHDQAFYEEMWSTILAGRVWRGEVVNRRKDGILRTEEMTITPLRDATGEVAHFISINQDVTENRMLAAQLQQAQRMEAIGTLAGGIAHDLNNILAPIILAGGVLRERLTDKTDANLLEMAHASATRGAEVVKQLLAFSRGEPGEKLNVQVRHLVKEMIAIMRETFPREIVLRGNVPDDVWVIVANPTQIHQVLLNLCVNARDAMPRGGVLTLTAANVEVPPNDPRLPPNAGGGAYVMLEVVDTGHGIPAEIRTRIFDPFFTTKPPGKGTGLGLSTVMAIVKSHDGFVTSDSAPGHGSAFRVFLPAIAAGARAAPHIPAPLRRSPRRETILVVDDEPLIRRTTQMVLEQQNFQVLTAGNGVEALSVFLENRTEIRVVLTDVMMPELGGLALVRALRGIEPGLKILVTSGLADIAQRKELEALGVGPVIQKPADPESLVRRIQQCLGGSGSGGSVSPFAA